MEDKLKKIFGIQREFTKKFFFEKFNIDYKDIKNDKDMRVLWSKDYILSTIKEVTEILDEMDWKNHTAKDDSEIHDNILEEAIDTMKYLFGLLLINGFDEDDIYKKFIDKSQVVDAKYEQEKSKLRIKEHSNKIIFVDIDGVLAKWPERYIQFVNEKEGTNFDNLTSLLSNVENKRQLELKEQYRLSGIKKNLDVIDGSVKFLSDLKESGYDIVLLTARPYKRFFRIYSDTLEWLNKNGFVYDNIIFDEKKEKYIIKNFKKDNVKFIIDDDISNAKKLAENGFKVYLKYNGSLYDRHTFETLKENISSDNITVIRDLCDIREEVLI